MSQLKNKLSSVTMSCMKNKRAEQGSASALLVPVILLALLFIGSASFGVWAYSSRQDYKTNSDAKVAEAVTANKKVVQAADAKQFAEEAKKPLKAYDGPAAYGSLHVMYPKTWSAYVDISGGSEPLNAYFKTDYVPAKDMKQPYNLRVRVNATSYNSLVQGFQGLVRGGKVTSVPYKLPQVPDVAGVRLDGQAVPGNPQANGTLIMLPMRDKTLQIWTESPDFLPDFTDNILANLTFSP
jgi:hypothetical protein